MNYKQIFKKIEQCLFWLNLNIRNAIELKEMFTCAANDKSLHMSIKGTKVVRGYNVNLKALYFEYVMTLMRIFDAYERDTASLKNIFVYLHEDDFIKTFEKKSQRDISQRIKEAEQNYKALKGSHYLARLSTVRNKLFAHTTTEFNRNELADYNHADELLIKTIPIIQDLHLVIYDKEESYDKFSEYWKGYAAKYWTTIRNN
jgi:hypothetical protein